SGWPEGCRLRAGAGRPDAGPGLSGQVRVDTDGTTESGEPRAWWSYDGHGCLFPAADGGSFLILCPDPRPAGAPPCVGSSLPASSPTTSPAPSLRSRVRGGRGRGRPRPA
ncbi:hypothetical protein FQN60_009152, partial [Etheostoma spectabile]